MASANPLRRRDHHRPILLHGGDGGERLDDGGKARRDRGRDCRNSRSGGRGYHQLGGWIGRARSGSRGGDRQRARPQSERPSDVREQDPGGSGQVSGRPDRARDRERFRHHGRLSQGRAARHGRIRLRFGAVGGNHRGAARRRQVAVLYFSGGVAVQVHWKRIARISI